MRGDGGISWCVIACVLAVHACGDDTGGGEVADAAVGSDAAVDAARPRPVRDAAADATEPDHCEAAQAAIAALSNVALCNTVDDCVLLGSCDNTWWVAVAAKDAMEASYFHSQCEGGFDGIIPGLACEEGRCVTFTTYHDGGEPAGPEWCGGDEDGGARDDAG